MQILVGFGTLCLVVLISGVAGFAIGLTVRFWPKKKNPTKVG